MSYPRLHHGDASPMLIKNKLPAYDGSRFTWSGRQGSADASDLGIPPGQWPGQQVWSDSADMGFYVSGRQETLMFVLDHVERNDDGSIRSWSFSTEGGRFGIKIFND